MHGRLILSALLLGSGLGWFTPGGCLRARAVPSPGLLPTPQFRHYDLGDGFPAGAVHDVVQDHDGIIWLAVGSKLVRFDGIEFQALESRPDDPAALPIGSERQLFVDRDNGIWAWGPGAGLARRLAGGQGSARWSHASAVQASLSSDDVLSLAQTPDGAVWVGTSAGLDRLLPDGHGFEHVALSLPSVSGAAFGAVSALLAEADGGLWVGTGHGLFKRDAGGGFEAFVVGNGASAGVAVWRIQGGGNDVRVATAAGLLRVDADRVLRPLGSAAGPQEAARGSVRDRLGRLWIATRGGLYFDDGSRSVRIPAQPQLRGALPGNNVARMLMDLEGGLWLALDEDGLAYLAPGWNEFSRYTHVPGDGKSLHDYAASAVQISGDGQLWVGFDGALDKLDPVTGRVQHVLGGLPGEVRDVLEDRAGKLWIISAGEVFRRSAGGVLRVGGAAMRASLPLRLLVGPDGTVLVETQHRGLLRIEPGTLALQSVPGVGPAASGMSPNRLGTGLAPTWYVAGDRVLRWNSVHAVFEVTHGLRAGGRIRALEETADGLWLARRDQVEHYRAYGLTLTRDRSVPIPVDWRGMTLLAVHADGRGRIWLFGREGLRRIDAQDGRTVALGLRHGLLSGRMRGVSPVRTADGSIFFAGPDGVVGFQPERAVAPPGSPRVIIASARVGRDGQMLALPAPSATVQLDWNDGGPRIAARLASYVMPQSNRYRFWLHGLDPDWVDTGHLAERQFPELEAGDYTLEVAAAGAEGGWNTLTEPLHLTVGSPPWEAWQAWALYVAFAAMLLVLVLLVQHRCRLSAEHLRTLETQRRMAEQASEAKTVFLTTLSHEIRTPMTGLMGMTELLLNGRLAPVQRDHLRSIQRSGSMLMSLLNDALDLARIEAGRLALDVAPFDPRALLREIQLQESGLAELKGIALELQLARELPRQVVGDALRVKQVLLNLVNNALKFTDRGRVLVVARPGSPGLLVSISDTGPGIPEAGRAHLFERFEQLPGPQRSAGTGLGLAICRELLGLMGGSIRNEPADGGGTTFLVQLPLPSPSWPGSQPAKGSRQPPHWDVLLVENDAGMARRVAAVLEARGHSVRQVGNGLDALSELAHARFDLVLLETELGGLDGFRVARLMRKVRVDRPGPAIVAIAAHVDRDGEARVRSAGMNGLVCKPLRDEQWLRALAHVMGAQALHGSPQASNLRM